MPKLISVKGDGHCCHRPSSNWETNQRGWGSSNATIYYIHICEVLYQNEALVEFFRK